MIRVSVIAPTYRAGLDVICDSLAAQTFRDFEYIVADAIYDQRAPLVRDRLASYDFPIKHLRPSGGPALSNYCRSINDAIVAASGELVVIQTDYTWMPPDCLGEHWRAYQASDKRTCILRDNHCTTLPPLHPEFRGYGPDMEQFTEGRRAQIEAEINAGADAYAADLAAGKLDRFMWSIFSQDGHMVDVAGGGVAWLWHAGPKSGTIEQLPVTRSDVKQGRPQIDYRHCSLKNEGIPLEAFLAVNGLDERFDGSHLYQDQEFALRVERAGYRWTMEPGAAVSIINPRTVLSSKRLERPMDTNGVLMQELLASGNVRANPGRDLRAERAVAA